MTAKASTSPSPWIRRHAPLVPPGGSVLDVPCGGGRHSAFFLQRGHPVTAVDRDVSGLAHLDPHEGLEVLEADLETEAPWPLLGRTFDGVVVTNYLWRPLFAPLLATVAPGGLLLYESFAAGNEALGRPRNRDFLLQEGELLELCRGRLQVVAYESGRVKSPREAIVQRICAVADWQPKPLFPEVS